mgnify:CR=1 FL=1
MNRMELPCAGELGVEGKPKEKAERRGPVWRNKIEKLLNRYKVFENATIEE